jgi:pilus assembly protein CpaF
VSIRRFGARPLTAEDLLANESLTGEMLDFLAACVRGRINMIVSGGTGTGKTTLLNALSRFIPNTERVVTIEDTAELELQQRHVAKMEARVADAAGEGEVSLRELVKNSLRMRPDRVIVGECRGAEVLDMLQAMNTGHEGTMTTVHANDPREALARIELMAALAGVDIPVWAVRKLVASSVNLVVQVARLPGGRRKVVAISEITGMEGDIVSMHALFEFVQTGVDAGQVAVGYYRATGLRPRCLDKLRVRGADVMPQMFAERVLHGAKNGGPRR